MQLRRKESNATVHMQQDSSSDSETEVERQQKIKKNIRPASTSTPKFEEMENKEMKGGIRRKLTGEVWLEDWHSAADRHRGREERIRELEKRTEDLEDAISHLEQEEEALISKSHLKGQQEAHIDERQIEKEIEAMTAALMKTLKEKSSAYEMLRTSQRLNKHLKECREIHLPPADEEEEEWSQNEEHMETMCPIVVKAGQDRISRSFLDMIGLAG